MSPRGGTTGAMNEEQAGRSEVMLEPRHRPMAKCLRGYVRARECTEGACHQDKTGS